MPAYVYRARDTNGRSVQGTMTAASREDLMGRLRKLGYMTTQVKEAAADINLDAYIDRFTTISPEDMIMFNIQLANMVNAGIPLLTSLKSLVIQIPNKRLQQVIQDVTKSVESGESFSEAVARHPRIFSLLFVNMVRAGEASGKLGTILLRLSQYAEQMTELRYKITSAVLYPAILLLAGIGVALFIVTNIVPKFAEIFEKVGVELPVPTLILSMAGNWLKDYWYVALLLLAAAAVAFVAYGKTKIGRIQYDYLKLNLFLVGDLYRKAAVSRFTRTFGMLVESGVPILSALDIVKDVIGNEVLSQVIGNVYLAVEKGERISEPLKLSGQFPMDVVQMIGVGEETGNLEHMLSKVSDLSDLSVSYALKRMTTLLEPLLLVFMGGMIGFIMAAMILPIFDMMRILRH